ncbi:MAG: bdhA1 [Rickettsiaceae bacterium]|jgi:3-hydroxybutyrate dehydrogenase|nr:bdhA1 [Rickettsiaceae bacterium]
MKGKVAIITGSTSGIGLGVARKFASLGMNIVINGFGDAAQIEETRLAIEKEFKVKVKYSSADVTKINHIEELFILAKKMGGVDILINNAGIQFVSPIDEFPIEKWEAIIQTNLLSAFYTTRSAIPVMKQKGWGRIINIASAHGLVASPFKSAYVAAKHGIIGLTKSVALEVAEKNITVNSICPGYVKTPLVLGQVTATAKARNITEEEVIKNVMLGPQYTKRFVTIEEVAAIAAFLCSNDAASITGSSIAVDGGWTAH